MKILENMPISKLRPFSYEDLQSAGSLAIWRPPGRQPEAAAPVLLGSLIASAAPTKCLIELSGENAGNIVTNFEAVGSQMLLGTDLFEISVVNPAPRKTNFQSLTVGDIILGSVGGKAGNASELFIHAGFYTDTGTKKATRHGFAHLTGPSKGTIIERIMPETLLGRCSVRELDHGVG